MSKTALRRTLQGVLATAVLTPTLVFAAAQTASASVGSTIIGIAQANLGNGPCDTNSEGGSGYYNSCSEAWCADFAKWVWAQSGVNVTGLTAAAGSFGQYNGGLKSTPHVGDAVVFNYNGAGYADHVALVKSINADGTITTIGGNQNNSVTYGTIKNGYYNTQKVDGYVSPIGGVDSDPAPAPVFTQTAAADFTGDGEADIIARDGAGKLKMWKHNPEGFFNSAVDVTSGWNFTQTVAGDFNNDNKADIVARDADANLKMWLGRGDGTFNAAVQVTAGWNFTQTAAADFDGNGKDDLIARDASGNLKIWAGRGDGTFGAAAQVSSGWNFTQTAAADFNGDNQADIIAKDASGNLKLWTHNPAGVFNPAVTVTGGWNFSQTTAADVDGNGKADLIARNDSTGDLTIWAGRGDTTFGAPNVLTSGW
ncbi:FG-GAP-like repeat-containing protein [Streptomyces sp. NPDC047974]|uniref:FG-GAP-like repeat-containing protein n=1 Tax=Streptomyces sp. NPDC047974 TaxID=3154343 RepID=UPI0033E56229